MRFTSGSSESAAQKTKTRYFIQGRTPAERSGYFLRCIFISPYKNRVTHGLPWVLCCHGGEAAGGSSILHFKEAFPSAIIVFLSLRFVHMAVLKFFKKERGSATVMK